MENFIGFKCYPLPERNGSPLDPQLAGAIGAALFAKALYEKSQKK
jgi:hypothetical protein